jgi:hypothetical protein
MNNELGVLGNIEVYLFLPARNNYYYRGLKNAIKVEPTSILKNNWELNIIGEEIIFDAAFFSNFLAEKEEILVQYVIDDNLVSVILLQNRIIVRISFKPWNDIEHDLVDLIFYLLSEYKLLAIGFELDFDYANESLEQVVSTLISDKTNYPIISKEPGKELLEHIEQNYQVSTLELLKKKTSQLITLLV